MTKNEKWTALPILLGPISSAYILRMQTGTRSNNHMNTSVGCCSLFTCDGTLILPNTAVRYDICMFQDCFLLDSLKSDKLRYFNHWKKRFQNREYFR